MQLLILWASVVLTPFAQSNELEFYSGDVLELEQTTSSPEAKPDYYVIQAGDTLWDLSRTFWGDPYYWPQLWSYNDQITNPHWIYPGNRIAFSLGTLLDPPDMELEVETVSRQGYTVESVAYEEVETTCGPDIHFTDTIPADHYLAPGFLSHKRHLEVLGEVAKARPTKVMLADKDMIYLKVKEPDAYSCGDVFSIFRPLKSKIRHPHVRRLKYGNLYRIVGEAKVIHRSGEYLTATIRHAYSEVLRGDLLGPLVPVNIEVEVEPPQGDLQGTVVSRLTTEARLAGEREVIFLDRGRADGLRVGHTFYAVEQRDEVLDRKAEDTRLPMSVTGRVVVVRVDDYSSTAIVVDANRPITIGMRLTMTVN